LFLGYEWLRFHNPSVDWQSGDLKFDRCPKACRLTFNLSKPEEEEDPDVVETFPTGEVEEGDRVFAFDFFEYRARGGQHIRAHTTTTQQLAEEATKEMATKSFEELVPPHHHKFQDIFSKESFDELPQ
ncbi:hypothetical protein OG21DRAFT_1399176, partial [Imleria badia]